MVRKYNLPKYICFDVRTTLCRKKPTYDVTLAGNDGKAHSTKTLTVYEAVTKVVQNRVTYKGWTTQDVAKYIESYDYTMENQYSLEDACKEAGVTLESVMNGEYMKTRYPAKKAQENTQEEITEVEEVVEEVNAEEEISKNAKKDLRTRYLEYLKKNPQWFTIANFPEYQIYSEPYMFTNEYGVSCYTYRIRNLITKKELKPTTKSNSLYVHINGINKAVYKLAADSFLHNPNKKRDDCLVATEVHHLNGNHEDNRLENLEHVTKEMHVAFHKQLNENKEREYLTYAEVVKFKAEYAAGESIYKIAQRYGKKPQKVKLAIGKTPKQLKRLLDKESSAI